MRRCGTRAHRRPVPRWLRELIYVEQGGRCHYCNRMCVPTDGRLLKDEDQPDNLFTMDHIQSLRRGGSYDRSNLIGACKRCNREKGSRSMRTFLGTRTAPPTIAAPVAKPPVRVRVREFEGPRRVVDVRDTTTRLARVIMWARRLLGFAPPASPPSLPVSGAPKPRSSDQENQPNRVDGISAVRAAGAKKA